MALSRKKQEPFLEEAISEDWEKDLETVEVSLEDKPLFYTGLVIFLIGCAVIIRILLLGVKDGDFYAKRAEANLDLVEQIPAPRGLIYDRYGKILAENQPSFSALLKIDEFFKESQLQDETLNALENILGISRDDVLRLINENDLEKSPGPILLANDLTQSQVVQLKGLDLPTIDVKNSFQRDYPEGQIYSSFVGYVGPVSKEDLKSQPELTFQDLAGKTGLEYFYDQKLRGKNGEIVRKRNAKGAVLEETEKSKPEIGQPLHLTIDAEFQKYFYGRMEQGLQALGRTSGVGLALNPQNGEVLALVNFPVYDNNIFETGGHSQERMVLLNSEEHPLFNRAISGFYNPGSTIKPLVGVAALTEGVIDTQKTIFSPGYLDVPNPYDSSRSTRYLDWRYQGNVNLYSAIAQSSNVYFYEVGGGFPGNGIRGLGITRLYEWWQKFNLGDLTGIDLPGEADGFLPTVDWKEKTFHQPWLLGDTYNVSIGQGDLLLTPIQLLDYIAAIANGGKIYQPILNRDAPHPKIIGDLSYLRPQIQEVQKGMSESVGSPLGTAHLLSDLGFPVAAKTGSAQVENNRQENAFFVGYAPAENPQVAVLVLVEHSLQGSLNAVPIAKDVLNWYYWNRIRR